MDEQKFFELFIELIEVLKEGFGELKIAIEEID
jgi:hypothetical protein